MLALQASSQTIQVYSSELMWQKLVGELQGTVDRLEKDLRTHQETSQRALT